MLKYESTHVLGMGVEDPNAAQHGKEGASTCLREELRRLPDYTKGPASWTLTSTPPTTGASWRPSRQPHVPHPGWVSNQQVKIRVELEDAGTQAESAGAGTWAGPAGAGTRDRLAGVRGSAQPADIGAGGEPDGTGVRAGPAHVGTGERDGFNLKSAAPKRSSLAPFSLGPPVTS